MVLLLFQLFYGVLDGINTKKLLSYDKHSFNWHSFITIRMETEKSKEIISRFSQVTHEAMVVPMVVITLFAAYSADDTVRV